MCYEGGIREFVTFINENKTPSTIRWSICPAEGRRHGGGRLQYNDGYNEIIVSFANNVHTPRAACTRRASSGP